MILLEWTSFIHTFSITPYTWNSFVIYFFLIAIRTFPTKTVLVSLSFFSFSVHFSSFFVISSISFYILCWFWDSGIYYFSQMLGICSFSVSLIISENEDSSYSNYSCIIDYYEIFWSVDYSLFIFLLFYYACI